MSEYDITKSKMFDGGGYTEGVHVVIYKDGAVVINDRDDDESVCLGIETWQQVVAWVSQQRSDEARRDARELTKEYQKGFVG